MSRFTRHLILFLASAATAAAFYGLLAPASPVWRLSMASAYGSLALLALTLMIGPWNKLRGRSNPVSGYLRRDVGIWAGILGIAHVIAGLQVHFDGRMALYFFRPDNETYSLQLRWDPFGLANHAGLVATLILVILLLLSNNASLRTLGAHRWKYLQRWNYAGALLVVAHAFVYQVLEKRTVGFAIAGALIVLSALAMQAAGFVTTRKQDGLLRRQKQ